MIGIFDSGIGGLSLTRELFRQLPGYDTIYFGDVARTPYGTKSLKTVRDYAREAFDLLQSRGARLLIIACNTASAAAAEDLRARNAMPVFDVVSAGARAVITATRNGHIALMGTPATIRSGKHRAALEAARPDIAIEEYPCPSLATMIEDPVLDPSVVDAALRSYVGTVAATGADTLVLACTHYPLIANRISAVVGNSVTLVDPAAETVKEVRSYLALHPEIANNLSRADSHTFLVSDQGETFAHLVEKFLGKQVGVEVVQM